MDSNKVLVGFVVALVAFLAFPVVMNKMKPQNPSQPVATAATATTATTVSGGAPPPTSGPKLDDPPALNEQSLVGSSWEFFFQSYKVKLTFAANGVAYATHPMAKALTGMDYIEGRWRLQYNKLFLNASVGGNEINYEFQISGTKVYLIKDGKVGGEMERF